MNVKEIVFSPAGGTLKVAEIIGNHWNKDAEMIDLCDVKAIFAKCEINKEDMVLIAMPSYGGRVPAIALERLKQIRGNGAKCTLVCVYGNRAYEDTLVEMEDAAKECGFQVIAAIAAVAEHSIIPKYAANRPDAVDKKQLIGFADQIINNAKGKVAIPGNRPYKKAGGAGLVPKSGKGCVKCGLCARKCPAEAIDLVSFKADSKKCFSCMRCVKLCPEKAREVNGAMVSVAAVAIKKACSVRKENELFL